MATIVGRDHQTSRIDALLDEAVDGRGAAAVLRGEAGIGKSVLLEYAIRTGRDRGLRVLTVAGVQAEGRIPYAGLEHLLRPLRPTLMPADSPYRLAIDLLAILGESAEPVLLAIEDAHWLDAETWETLAFLCRRIESDRIAVVMAVRDGADVDLRLAASGLPELSVNPLSPEEAGLLLDQTAPGLIASLRTRVLDEAAGNPLGLVELGGAVARSGGSALLPSSLPLSTRVERTFGGLVADLPSLTQDLLLVAALNDGGNLDEILAAAAELTGAEVSADAIQPAVTARLVSVDEAYDLRFRHPLLRSALNQQAPPGNRRRVHGALAKILSGRPARQLWHRAAAASGPDEALARELSDTAMAAANRQTPAFARMAMARAIQLSEDPRARGRRQMDATRLALQQGDAPSVRQLLNEIDDSALTLADRARLTWMRETFSPDAWSGAERMLTYAELIDRMRVEGGTEVAAEAFLDLALRVYYSNLPAHIRDRFAEVALALGLAADDPRLTAILTLVAPVEHGAAALDRLRSFSHQVDLNPVLRSNLSDGAWAVGAFDLAATLAAAAATELRRQGQIGELAQAMAVVASAHAALGDAKAALPEAVEAMALAEETGQPTWVLGAGLVAGVAEALRGDVRAARRRADEAEQVLTAVRRFPMLAYVQRIRGIAALAEGQADDAFRQLVRVFDPSDRAWFPPFQLHLLGHLAEAAALGGFQDELRPIVAGLEPVAVQSQSPSLRIGLGYAHAVLTGDYDAALADDLTSWPFDQARLQLTYGAVLRRSFHLTESRPLLRAAASAFDTLGATPWADRARAELRATGETRRKPKDTLAVLTPQEVQITRLAAQGLSNREIGERLFLSPRTVSTHLYRIYPKINVSSRAELARLITSSDVG